MTLTEVSAMFVMMLAGSLINQKFKTRDKAANWFESLNLDYKSGIGLGLVLVLAVLVAVMHLVPWKYPRNPFVFW